MRFSFAYPLVVLGAASISLARPLEMETSNLATRADGISITYTFHFPQSTLTNIRDLKDQGITASQNGGIATGTAARRIKEFMNEYPQSNSWIEGSNYPVDNTDRGQPPPNPLVVKGEDGTASAFIFGFTISGPEGKVHGPCASKDLCIAMIPIQKPYPSSYSEVAKTAREFLQQEHVWKSGVSVLKTTGKSPSSGWSQ